MDKKYKLEEIKILKDDKTLRELSTNKSTNIRVAVAENIYTPTEILDILAKDKKMEVRKAIAKNPKTSIETLDLMSIDFSDFSICFNEVPNHPKIQKIINEINSIKNSEDLEIYVGKYSCKEINIAIIENKNCTIDILRKLAKSKNIYVKEYISRLKNSPLDILELLKNDKWEEIRKNVAEHPNCSINLLTYLSNDKSEYVLKGVCFNNNCPSNILDKIYNNLKRKTNYSLLLNIYKNPNISNTLKKKLDKIDGELGAFLKNN